LNGLFRAGGPIEPSVFSVPVLVIDVLRVLAGDGIVESIDPKRPGNVPLGGESEFESKDMVEFTN
jgi:hypothetical protein